MSARPLATLEGARAIVEDLRAQLVRAHTALDALLTQRSQMTDRSCAAEARLLAACESMLQRGYAGYEVRAILRGFVPRPEALALCPLVRCLLEGQ